MNTQTVLVIPVPNGITKFEEAVILSAYNQIKSKTDIKLLIISKRELFEEETFYLERVVGNSNYDIIQVTEDDLVKEYPKFSDKIKDKHLSLSDLYTDLVPWLVANKIDSNIYYVKPDTLLINSLDLNLKEFNLYRDTNTRDFTNHLMYIPEGNKTVKTRIISMIENDLLETYALSEDLLDKVLLNKFFNRSEELVGAKVSIKSCNFDIFEKNEIFNGVKSKEELTLLVEHKDPFLVIPMKEAKSAHKESGRTNSSVNLLLTINDEPAMVASWDFNN